MRPFQWTLLLITVLAGILWVFLAQNWLFLNLFPGLLVGPGMNLEDYLQTGSSPSFAVLWISCTVALLVWLASTSSRRTRNAAEVRRMQPVWWFTTLLLVVLGCLYQLFFTVFLWQIRGESPIEGSAITSYPVPTAGWILLLAFVVLDVLLLFWLPTLLASPRSHRLVVPGAVTLLGGR